jgi:aspartate-semialdehyde dehydrogenase
LFVVQAPIFHGYAFAVYFETETPVPIDEFSQRLAGDHIVVPQNSEDAPTNVNAAGQGDILVTLARDTSRENGIWLWAAADNLRISALTAIECAESMTASRPRGQIQ